MATTTSNVNMFQKVLNEDDGMKSSYVNAENESDSESDDTCKIVIPRSKKRIMILVRSCCSSLSDRTKYYPKHRKRCTSYRQSSTRRKLLLDTSSLI